MDEIYKVALQQSYNLSISGGSHNTNYMISFGYYDQESNFVGPNYGRQRFNFRTNLNSEWGNFKVASTMAYNRIMDKSNPSGTGSVNTNVFRVPQYYNIKFKEGDQYIINEVVVDGNSLAQLEKGECKIKTTTISSVI